MKPRVYVETSVISYLTSHISRDLIAAARQQLTRSTWPRLIEEYEIVISFLVLEEASQGDPRAAAERKDALESLPILEIDDSVRSLAQKLIDEPCIPVGYPEDALHVAVAAMNACDFLLTWNFSHLNNAAMRPSIRHVVAEAGYECPEICSPEELLGEIL